MRRRERGSASIEIVALVPVLVGVAMLVFQLGVASWTAAQTQEAAREAARAKSLGRDVGGAAAGALPGSLHVKAIDADGDTVTLTVDVPKVSVLPTLTVTRHASMPRLR